jgi:hypothetical protein
MVTVVYMLAASTSLYNRAAIYCTCLGLKTRKQNMVSNLVMEIKSSDQVFAIASESSRLRTRIASINPAVLS